jgi:hypothetical protein
MWRKRLRPGKDGINVADIGVVTQINRIITHAYDGRTNKPEDTPMFHVKY